MKESRFEIISKISEGGMAEIFLVRDKTSGGEFALKRLLERHCLNRRIVRMFYREAEILSRLNHPDILKVYEYGKENRQPFVVMEYFKSSHLRELIKKDPQFDIDRGLSILYQVAAALDYVHSRGIIHMDVKPANVLVSDRMKIKLTDFGMAITFSQGKFSFCRTSGGTPSYMSPEQIQRRSVDRRSDIYSFGVMAYEVLAGRLPFAGENLKELLVKHTSRIPPPPPSKFIPDIPLLCDKMIMKCIEKDKRNRYQDMTHLLLDLSRLK
jgi:serine/threonine-protein kinase